MLVGSVFSAFYFSYSLDVRFPFFFFILFSFVFILFRHSPMFLFSGRPCLFSLFLLLFVLFLVFFISFFRILVLSKKNGAIHGAKNCDKHDARKTVANLDIVLVFSRVFAGAFVLPILPKKASFLAKKISGAPPYFGFGGTPAMAYVMQSHR